MSEREEQGLRRLKGDLDEAGWPAPELLARYATDPNRLTELEKQTVELALAASPLVADELATLRGFDFVTLDADRRGGLEGVGTIGFARRLRAWLAQPPVWAAVAALVALGFWLAQTRRGDVSTSPVEPLPQLVERETTPAQPTVPETVPETKVAERAAEADAGAPSASGESSPTVSPDGRSQAVQRPTDRPEATDDASRLAETDDESVQPRSAPREEILVAMAMPDYQPAYGVESMDGGAWIVRGGEAATVAIRALVPDHVTRACSPQPVLHWSLDRLPAAGDFFLTIVDEQDEPVVADRPLARPAHAGLQRLALDALGLTLPSGRTLRWSIALRADENAAPEAFAFGWLRVAAPSAVEAAALEAGGDAGRSAGFAELGCYAEALDAALRLRATRKDDPEPSKAVERLARQAGFDPALATPR